MNNKALKRNRSRFCPFIVSRRFGMTLTRDPEESLMEKRENDGNNRTFACKLRLWIPGAMETVLKLAKSDTLRDNLFWQSHGDAVGVRRTFFVALHARKRSGSSVIHNDCQCNRSRLLTGLIANAIKISSPRRSPCE